MAVLIPVIGSLVSENLATQEEIVLTREISKDRIASLD